MMSLFKTELAGSMLLSVGHRPGLAEYHDRVIVLSRGERGTRVSEPSSGGVGRLLGEVIKRGLRPRSSADPGASRAE
jgi:putative ATP-binding cassette transporter